MLQRLRRLVGTGGSGTLTLGNDAALTNERAFIPGTGLSGTDGGANGSYTLAINDSVVATVSGTTFTGTTKHNAGLSGSLTKLTDGTSYLIAGAGIQIITGSNGAVTITNDGTVGDITAVERKIGGGSKVSWHLLDNNEQPLVWGNAEVEDEAHQSWGSTDQSPVLNLTLAKLGLNLKQ